MCVFCRADGDKHTSWVRSFSQTLNEVEAFIKKYHTTGLVWNAKVRELLRQCSTVNKITTVFSGV